MTKVLIGLKLGVVATLLGGMLSCATGEDGLADQLYRYSGGSLTVIDDYGDCYLSLRGKITPALEPVMNRALQNLASRECVETIVIIRSLGGDLATAMHIGRELRSAGVSTDIHQYCDSACSFLYIGGARRLAHLDSNINRKSKLGIHQPSSDLFFGRCISESDDPMTVGQIKSYLATMLPDEAAQFFYKAMFSESCKTIGYLNAETMLKMGIATDGVDHH
jgi:hypothetical protein